MSNDNGTNQGGYVPKLQPYFVSEQNKAILTAVMARRKFHPVNLLVRGRHGMGKSALARQIAAVNALPYWPVPIGALQETGQLMGTDEATNGTTHFNPSDFIRAVQTPGALVHLEELNRPQSPKALNDLFPILDDSRCLWVEKLKSFIRVAPMVVFVATLNEGFDYTGIDPLDEAMRDRFYFIQLGYLSPEIERTLVLTMTGLSPDGCAKLVDLAAKLRFNAKAPIHVSTRRVLMAAELMVSGLKFMDAVMAVMDMDKERLETLTLALDQAGVQAVKGAMSAPKYVIY